MTVLGGAGRPPSNGVGPTDRERISLLASGHVYTAWVHRGGARSAKIGIG